MSFLQWRNLGWYRRSFVVLSLVLVVALASHPELRLLLPLIDALGLDVFVFLVGAQLLAVMRPLGLSAYRAFVLPSLRRVFALAIYLLGIAGPCVETYVLALCSPRRSAG